MLSVFLKKKNFDQIVTFMATIRVLMVNHCALLTEPAVSIVKLVSLLLLYLSFILCFGNTSRRVSKQPPRLVEKGRNYRGMIYVLESPKY